MKHRQKGQGLVEYVLVLVLVAVVIISILELLGPQIGNVFSRITNSLDASATGNNYAMTVRQSERVKHGRRGGPS
jgi:pilus assembly protein Flp/PilA